MFLVSKKKNINIVRQNKERVMRKNTLLVVFVLFSIFSVKSFPYGGGVSGYTLKTNTNGCGSCHSTHGSANTAVTVLIQGPSTLQPGQVGTFTAKITGGSGTKVGINIATSLGTLVNSDANLKVMNSELAQTSAKTFSGGQYIFNFKLTAPSTPGTVTLYATGMSSKTSWNFSSNFTVTVAADTVLAPSGLTTGLVVANPNKVSLSWTDNSTNETSFIVERKSTGSYSVIATLPANTTSYTDTSQMQNAVNYTYRVKAANTNTQSGYSNESIIMYFLPVELTSFSSSVVAGGIELLWETKTEKNNKGFIIDRKTDLGDWKEIGFVTGNGTTEISKNYSFIDKYEMNYSGDIYYRLKQVDYDGSLNIAGELKINVSSIPENFSLLQNYPNPFNPATRISFSIVKQGIYSLNIYNSLGQLVKSLSKEYPVGSYSFDFNAEKLSSGIYYYELAGEGYKAVKKMLLQK